MSATPPNEKSPLPPLTPEKHATSELTPPPSEHGDSLASSTEPESSAKQEHHVRWAPLKIPLERRLQMLAMLIYISLLFICLSAFVYSLLIPLLWPVVIAYLTFASLVPTFSFGENDIYEQLDNDKGSTVWKVQKRMQQILGFTLPLFHARGVFNYDVGLMPFRHPIVTVVGKPISVPVLESGAEPTQDQILAVQSEYINELQAIYDKYKDTYAKDRIQELRIVE
ncbi:hypothetical protein [Absidia glauca]|uniref:diacylglycerol O-acyltransferase n=1 Tax=Absidia glauca TaxID=4829 RepID=A0A163KR70_ABSGL|nr:hypothetical protein [Absidia glauca]